MPEEMIRAVTHPQGDWYVITHCHDGERGDRWWIDRVILWALQSGDKVVDHVAAIIQSGVATNPDPLMDIIYVLGTDKCPNGRTWNEIYQSQLPTIVGVREITEIGREWQRLARED